MFFQWFLVREEGKVSLKRWVRRSHVVRANIDDFLKLGCRNTAHRCGTKRVSKSKRTKHTSFGRLFKVRMSKQCTPLWREVRFQVKMHKTSPWSDNFWKFRCWNMVLVARSKFPSQNAQNTPGPDYFSFFFCWMLRGRPGLLFEVRMSKNCTPLWQEVRVQVKMYKAPAVWSTFGGFDVACPFIIQSVG